MIVVLDGSTALVTCGQCEGRRRIDDERRNKCFKDDCINTDRISEQ